MDPVHFRAVGVRVSAALGAKMIMFVAAWSRVLTFWQLVALLSSQTVELLQWCIELWSCLASCNQGLPRRYFEAVRSALAPS